MNGNPLPQLSITPNGLESASVTSIVVYLYTDVGRELAILIAVLLVILIVINRVWSNQTLP